MATHCPLLATVGTTQSFYLTGKVNERGLMYFPLTASYPFEAGGEEGGCQGKRRRAAYLHATGQLHQLLGVLLGAVPLGHRDPEELEGPLEVRGDQVVLRRLKTHTHTHNWISSMDRLRLT